VSGSLQWAARRSGMKLDRRWPDRATDASSPHSIFAGMLSPFAPGPSPGLRPPSPAPPRARDIPTYRTARSAHRLATAAPAAAPPPCASRCG
jgi:hypothetical protein